MGVKGLGARVNRWDDDRLLRGRGSYVDDIAAEGALEAVFVRSPHAHARVSDLDLEQASSMPGVVGVFGASDLGEYDRPLPLLFPHPDLLEPRTQHPMASDEVKYSGQIVAMIVAESRYRAEDAREQVSARWDPLPVSIDLQTAASDGAPLVHADMSSNISGRITQRVGDPDRAFEEAPVVITSQYTLERSAAMPMETRGILASFDSLGGRLAVWAATQVVHPLRSGLAQFFGIPEHDVRVVAPDTGGGFGVKGFFFYPEEVLLPWASMVLERPVKWIEDRVEHFTASHHERKQIHDVSLAADEDGRVLAIKDHYLLDTGAFVPYGLELGRITASQIGGPYRIPNIEIECVGVYTNAITCSPYRGAGRPHSCFATERALDDLARKVDLDPFEVRYRNFIGDDEFPYRREGLVTADGFTVVVDSGRYFEQLDMLERAVDLDRLRERQRESRKTPRWLGLGVACYVESTGGGPYEGAYVGIEADTGTVRVATGFTDQGQSLSTTLAQVAAEHLEVDPASIDVTIGDTSAFPWGVGTYASRGAVLGGNAVARAAHEVKEKALRIAARMLEVSIDDLELADGRIFVRGAPDAGLELRQVAKAAKPDRYGFDPEIGELTAFQPARPREHPDEGPLLPDDERPGVEATAYFSSRNATWASGAHAAIVEIDIETGELRFDRYVAVHDCGRVINPLIVDGQVLGGIAQGIAGSFFERLAYDGTGQLQNASLMDFLVPYATEIPFVELHHLETPSPLNPLGIKGAGEAGTIPVAAAVAAAVEDALRPMGSEVREMPLDPEALTVLAGAGGPEGQVVHAGEGESRRSHE